MNEKQVRYLLNPIQDDLKRKVVTIGGPRQVGKTTLARHLLQNLNSEGAHFNWDNDDDQRDLLAKKWSDEDRLLIFDELHKFPRWKNWIKGIWDTEQENHRIIVAGSARLDVYKQGGDSLLGRYHYWRLHPFTIDELPEKIPPKVALERLLTWLLLNYSTIVQSRPVPFKSHFF